MCARGPACCRIPQLVAIVCVCLAAAICRDVRLSAAEREFAEATTSFFREFCFDCHGNDEQEAKINIERMSADASFASSFKTWQKVAAMLEQEKMPPEDAPQPSAVTRQQFASLVRDELRRVARQQDGDPGQVVMRRLTGAEYAYTIQDLTGLDLNLQGDLVGDAVGGEGFTNIGVVQFVQDSTLERYLEAAKKVAAHAVIGAGPIQFFHDPGKTGFELSAIRRIQDIYRAHGFRTAAGEGGEPFGLDRYAKAFYAAWRYRYRERLGLGDATTATIAAEEEIDARFLEHIWSVLARPSPSFPTSEIVTRWQQLPEPKEPFGEHEQTVRTACGDLYRYLHDWQSRLAETASHDEQAAVLTGDSFHAAASHSFQADIVWEKGAAQASVQLSVDSVNPVGKAKPVVIWRNPRIRFRGWGEPGKDEQPLKSLLAEENARPLGFGQGPDDGDIGPLDLMTTGEGSHHLLIPVPDGTRQASLLVEAQLDLQHGDDCVVRCTISAGEDGKTAKTISALLADPKGTALQTFRSGVLEFGKHLPQISQREPAPSDRDPIPPPFDNAYNTRQRDYFHYKVKYHRDDRFLVENILDDSTRRQLDDAWTDLVTSFEYHDVLLRFVADKYNLNLDGRRIAELDAAWIDQLPSDSQVYVRQLHGNYASAQTALAAAEPGHLDDVLRFASRAWRRPLAADEMDRLRSFYEINRTDFQLDHPQAMRALLARILVAPDFIFRTERPAGEDRIARLSNWEVACRLSYFLWSSMPDAELRHAADAGELDDPQQLSRQAQRMLSDPKAGRFAKEFFGQWFGFYQFDRYRGVDPERFPEFTDRLKTAMYDEAVCFFAHMVQDDRPVRDLLFANYTFLNQELAKHYGVQLESTLGTAHERVENVNQFQRGGLFGLGAVLTVTSAPLRTSPVKRGDWILRRVLGTPVPPPPADAGSIPADDVLSDGLTVRERLEAHRLQPSCANCHSRIDPLGFALEHFDAIGRWRDRYRDGKAIDDSGTLHDRTHISGLVGLRNYLLSHERQFQRTLCTKLLGYALGRRELVSDAMLIEQMMGKLQDQDRFSHLVQHIVTSVQFRYHQGRADDQTTGVDKAPTNAIVHEKR